MISPSLLVMFDIDGTLTDTTRADEVCFVQALRDVFGFTGISMDWASYPHCTDSGILEELFQQRLGHSPLPAHISAFQSHFLSLLRAATAVQPFNPVPGAPVFISRLVRNACHAISLASGAWECSARLKLASAGFHLDQIPAAFADTAHAREDIMRTSLTRAAQSRSQTSFNAVIYLGDGVWDARAARKLGYRFIGISRDPAKTDRLYAEGASHVFPDYLNHTDCMLAIEQMGQLPK